MYDAERRAAELRALVERALAEAVPSGSPGRELYEPARYVLDGGGKRLRPMLVLLAAEAVGGEARAALPAAVAVEVFHNFTLVHDDIMDRSASRRGRPTVHVAWDEPTAILVGDLLMGIAYDHLARLPGETVVEALRVFGETVARLCEGQALDMAFAGRRDVSLAEYEDMIGRKTGALLSCALELGAVSASAPAAQRALLRDAGMHVGRAFQVQDDLLDLVAGSPGWGKPVGGDILEGKRTVLLLRAVERAADSGTEEDRELFGRILDAAAVPEDVARAREAMDRLGVLGETRDAVILHTDAALERLDALPDSWARGALSELVRSMQARSL